MAFADDMVVDHNVLLHQDQEDQDILSEFLDQRVFDSVNPNSPVNANGTNTPYHPDFDAMFLKIKTENDMLPEEYLKSDLDVSDHLQNTQTDQNYLYSSHDTFDRDSIANVTPDKLSPKDSSLSVYEMVRKEISKVKFGNPAQKVCPDSLELESPSFLDFSPAAMNALPYKLNVYDLPTYSRVETQIKLRFDFSPAPKETLIRIPQDLVSKTKHCLQSPAETLPDFLKKNMLYMDTYVMTSDGKTSCNICKRCIKREQKRASRSKNGCTESGIADSPNSSMNKNISNMWSDEDMIKKAIIYNSKEVVSFAPPTGLIDDPSRGLDFSVRIVCYCRHHKEQEGFKLLFVVKNYLGQVVAKHMLNPIMIMDRKKNQASSSKETFKSRVKSEELNGDAGDGSLHPLSPNSIDDSNSEALVNTDTNTDTISHRGTKRKKMSFDDSGNNSGNPMYNGSTGLSPLSNSDTNTSVHNMNFKNGLSMMHKNSVPGTAFPPLIQALPLPRQRLQQLFTMMQQNTNHPMIQKIIPAQGPIRGGIEVTLLGFNFRPGLNVKFGSKNSLATHCWSDTTMVTYLPPAAQPGQVLVSFESLEHIIPANQQLIFTYTDDTDRQLIELALQIVGLKMNGKLEDAKNIAKRIVGSDSQASSKGNTPPQSTVGGMNQASKEWYDSAHKTVEQLVKSELTTEEVLINFLSLVDLPNCPIIIPNWQLCNNQGQSLLHLATLKKYTHLIKFLITHGCKIDIKDNQGLTPLFFASMCGHRDLMKVFLECKSNWNLKLANDKVMKDYCDINVLDVFSLLEAESYTSDELNSINNSGKEADEELTKSYSVDSLNSLFVIDYGKHISKMVMESSAEETQDARNQEVSDQAYDSPTRSTFADGYGNDSSDFADSELESDDSFSDNNRGPFSEPFRRGLYEEDDYDDDYNDYESSDAVESESDEEHIGRVETNDSAKKKNLWQKMKNAVFHSENSDAELPSYDDLFPFGHSSVGAKPKTQVERRLNLLQSIEGTLATRVRSATEDDAGLASDSSEDMVISYINHPRKTIESDRMLFFFWLPILVFIIGLFLYVGITGQKVGFVERFKDMGRNTLGNFMVGNERIGRIFRKEAINEASRAIRG